jgi:hypothetical protein
VRKNLINGFIGKREAELTLNRCIYFTKEILGHFKIRNCCMLLLPLNLSFFRFTASLVMWYLFYFLPFISNIVVVQRGLIVTVPYMHTMHPN